jgi:hypothetical protein
MTGLRYPDHRKLQKEKPVQKLDPDQLQFVEILARLMAENELFKEEYSEQDFEAVITWLTKLGSQIDITIEMLREQQKPAN